MQKKIIIDLTVRYLSQMGIAMNQYSDIVKGAVFSYSIQHGQKTAAECGSCRKNNKYVR